MDDKLVQILREGVFCLLPEIEHFLCETIRFPSTPGSEREVTEYASKAFSEVASVVDKIPIPNSLRNDTDYSDPIPGLTYDDRYNLRVVCNGVGGGRSLLLNTHLDVVPASSGQQRPFDPAVTNGIVYGRGACDAKGQAATILLTLGLLREMGICLLGDLIIHLVVEEEVGGNGTLAMVRRGEKADAAVVLEPTGLQVLSSVRGAIWFRVKCQGKAGHPGRPGENISALNMAREIIDLLERYHSKLLAQSGGIPLFDRFENPMPLTFGRLSAGDWPAASPGEAILEGVLGFLPNKTRQEIMNDIIKLIDQSPDQWLREHTSIKFTYRHDAHVLDPSHPLVQQLMASCKEEGIDSRISALTASCDSWFYNNQLSIPTVVFGPGRLEFAHSQFEQISMEEIAAAARVLARFIITWCGIEQS